MVSAGELYIYLGTFIALLATGLGFPIPEEVPIVAAGVLTGQYSAVQPAQPAEVVALLAFDPCTGFPAGPSWVVAGVFAQQQLHPELTLHLRWWLFLPVCIIGVVIGDAFLYSIGRLFGTRLLDMPFMARLLPPDKRRRIESNFHHYGIKILLFARLLPGIRSPIFITAGIMRLPLRHFMLADLIYAIPGVSLLFFLAYWFTNSFQELVLNAEAKVVQIRHVLILVAIIGVAIYFLIHFLRRPVTTGDPKELPLIGEQVAHHVEINPNGEAPDEPTGEKKSRCLTEPGTPEAEGLSRGAGGSPAGR